ncbi:hypothetical protein BpHYR1_050552 [Brachionus plicatilis]|uniref:HAT C-terminal dimerisation domain-containing protein n=1 Tax=Brachionus plicatilis TaxID=10195 RepID=A0A3M7SCX2_BRAPC|nr:hypothetical protein BpHYR1_050552 [Brachionus plicatilis]
MCNLAKNLTKCTKKIFVICKIKFLNIIKKILNDGLVLPIFESLKTEITLIKFMRIIPVPSQNAPVTSEKKKLRATLQLFDTTSVPAEQLFSHTGNTLWDRRNRLSPDKLDKIMTIFYSILIESFIYSNFGIK